MANEQQMMKFSVVNDLAFNPEPLELVDLGKYEPVNQETLDEAVKKNRELLENVEKEYQMICGK